MPRPSLGFVVRHGLAVGWLSAVGLSPLVARTEEARPPDSQIVPAEYRQRALSESARQASDLADDFPYHGLTVVQAGSSSGSTKRQAVAEMPLDALTPPQGLQ